MDYDLLQIIIIEVLLVLRAEEIVIKLQKQRLQENIMILQLKRWLIKRGVNV